MISMSDHNECQDQLTSREFATQDRLIQVLTLEYEALRAEILVRISGRYQFLGIMTASAALLSSGLGHGTLGSYSWILLVLALAVFSTGLLYFWRIGRHLIFLSSWMARLEQRINSVVSGHYDFTAPLSWESSRPERIDRWTRLSIGPLAPRI
jgi:hypothetical protein